MAGILDAKSRVVDFILTDEGRRQVRAGDLQIEYASFSDRDTFYEEEEDGVASDATSRIYFEASPRYQDRIVVESNLGVITNFQTKDYDLDGIDVTTSPTAPRFAGETLTLTGSQPLEISNQIITEITKNFYDQEMIANEDVFSTQQGFDISREDIEFQPTNEAPINLLSENGSQVASLTTFQDPLTDKKFAHFPQFTFMPPVNEENTELGGQQLGFYPNFNQAEIMSYDELKAELEGIPYKEIEFHPTSRDNNIIIQPFEFTLQDGKIEKLQVIDFGIFPNESGTNAGVHVFFVGKIRTTAAGKRKFLNIFTLELDV